MGFGKIITTASVSTAEELKTLGATHVIDRKLSDSEIKAEVQKIVKHDLVYVFDTINVGPGISLGVSLLSTSKRGALASVAGGAVDASAAEFADKKAGFEVRNVLAFPWAQPDLGASYCEHVGVAITRGVIKPAKYSVVERLDLAAVNKVLQDYTEGKAVLQPHIHMT